MKTVKSCLCLILLLILAACRAAPAQPATETLHTAAGDFEVAAGRFVDEVHGVRPEPGEKLLLVPLTGPGGAKLNPASFSLEAFQTAIHDTSNGEVHLEGDDGSYAISTMAGWVDNQAAEFAIGFRVPAGAKTFKLFWPGNKAIEIVPVQ